MPRRFLAALVLMPLLSLPANAAQICAWLVETDLPDHVRALDIWFESDSSIVFLYALNGKGIVSNAGESNAPVSGSYSLRPGIAVKFWHHETTFYPPGKIDLDLEIRKVPTDYYSSKPTTALASFTFSRAIPASETSSPPTLAKKQCIEIVDGG